MIFTDLLVKEMCLQKRGNYAVELQGSAEHSFKNTEIRDCLVFL
jgi:hypothetical protein